jgi:hypothetical protein
MQEKTHGGKREGSGAKRKADVEKANEVFLSMIKSVHDVETDEEAKQQLAKTLYSFERGQMFIAEHIFGKPKETIETTHNLNNFDIKEMFQIDKDKQ